MAATQITRPLIASLRQDIDAALLAIGAKHGVKLSAGNARFTDLSATINVQVAVIAEDTDPSMSAERIQARNSWKEYAEMYGINPALLDTVINTPSGKSLKIVGLMPNKRKMPVLAVDMKTGKSYVMPVTTLAVKANA